MQECQLHRSTQGHKTLKRQCYCSKYTSKQNLNKATSTDHASVSHSCKTKEQHRTAPLVATSVVIVTVIAVIISIPVIPLPVIIAVIPITIPAASSVIIIPVPGHTHELICSVQADSRLCPAHKSLTQLQGSTNDLPAISATSSVITIVATTPATIAPWWCNVFPKPLHNADLQLSA